MNKYVASCLQHRFPTDDWQEAETILALYCGDRLTFENHAYIDYMDEREHARRRNRIQLQVINMSEGDLGSLRQYAMREAQIARKPWDTTSFPYGDWLDASGKLRGVETTDYNNDIVLIRADVDVVGQAFADHGAVWKKEIMGQGIHVDRSFCLAFQLSGSIWTQLLPTLYQDENVLEKDWQRSLSERLQTRVIDYKCSDLERVLAHRLYESGKLLETMHTESDDWKYGDSFVSHRADITRADLEEISRFDISHQLFIEEEAYEPGIETRDLLCQPGPSHLQFHRHAMNVCLPDWDEDTHGGKGKQLLRRVDYIALA